MCIDTRLTLSVSTAGAVSVTLGYQQRSVTLDMSHRYLPQNLQQLGAAAQPPSSMSGQNQYRTLVIVLK